MTTHNNQDLGRKPSVGAKLAPSQGLGQGRRAPMERIGISGELESMLTDYQQSKGSSNLVRASSNNVMLMGTREMESSANEKYGVREPQKPKEPTGSLCRAISTRMDPKQLKVMGNEDYKVGRFAEALALYEHAILIDPSKASYRLGDAEKALYHYKHSGPEADITDIAKAKVLQTHLLKCTEARRHRDWNTLIKETGLTISSGADSAPQVWVDRFDDAVVAAQRASRLDSSNKEINAILRRTRGAAAARSNGNELFKISKILEACTSGAITAAPILNLSRASSIIMLLAYVTYIFFQLKTHRQLF
ncbi:hypothetical protein GIB67_033076 [Kingdonia uniflora]|uniref:Uncharacterized protein n=1 Tax=Kingdonia uniflora TaxID=39325 RepID=A0A7J7MZ01_9MAGN|nr:hypothetical protein GIB67_033076 [Kingdonia uniflora]